MPNLAPPPPLLNGNNMAEEAPLRSSSSSCETPVFQDLLSSPNNVNNNKNLLNNNNNNARIIVYRVNLNEKKSKKTEHKVAEGFLEDMMETLTNNNRSDNDDDDEQDRPCYAVKLRSTSTDCSPWIGHYDDLAFIVRKETGNSSTILGVFSGVATFSHFKHGCLYQLLDLDHIGTDNNLLPKTVVTLHRGPTVVKTSSSSSFHLDKLGIKVIPVDQHPYWNGFPKKKRNCSLPVGGSGGGGEQGGYHDFKYHRAVNAFIANAPADDGEKCCADYVVEYLYFRPSSSIL